MSGGLGASGGVFQLRRTASRLSKSENTVARGEAMARLIERPPRARDPHLDQAGATLAFWGLLEAAMTASAASAAGPAGEPPAAEPAEPALPGA